MINTHIIRLGTHTEKDYLLLARSWYDEVILNANLVEGTGAATAVFLQRLASMNKAYTIDPYNFVFAFDPQVISSQSRTGEIRLKRTFRRLREQYLVSEITRDDRLSTTSFNGGAINLFSAAVAEYQSSRIARAIADSAEFLDLEGEEIDLRPRRILAPYFELSGELEWLDVNLRLLEASRSLGLGDTWGVVCIDGLTLDNDEVVDEVAQAYAGALCDGYMVWPTDFYGPTVTLGQIRGLRNLVRTLAGTELGRPVIHMYGGYFSALLHEEGMTGIAHGLGDGERRSLIPAVGGGMPPARYYLRPIHEGISMSDLRQLLRTGSFPSTDIFRNIVCMCSICSHLLQGGVDNLSTSFSRTDRKPFGNSYRDYPTQDVYKMSRFHFLSNRHTEIEEINKAGSRDALLEQLEESYAFFQPKLSADLAYLRRWRRALA